LNFDLDTHVDKDSSSSGPPGCAAWIWAGEG
jgi:hypothetical protein